MGDCQGAVAGSYVASALKGTSPAGRTDINLIQELRILPELRRRLHHDVILIQRRIHRRYLALTESIVERVVDQLRGDVEPRSGRAIVSTMACSPWFCRSLFASAMMRMPLIFASIFGEYVMKVLEIIALHVN